MSELALQGKVALVTGAGSPIGLGKAMTLALVRAGARVAMVDVDETALVGSTAEARALGGDGCVATVVADVTRADDAEMAVQETVARLGRFDVLINNAGINPRFEGLGNEPAFSRITIEAWTATVAVNVNGPFFMARAAVPRLIAQGWGRIIGVTTSFDTMTRTAPYGPSKAAHEALVAVMARELEGSGVTANVLIPGAAVRTNMTLDRIQSELLDPQIMQAPVVWLASPSSDGVNGRRIVAENWDERLPLPERVARASAPVAWPQLGRQRTAG